MQPSRVCGDVVFFSTRRPLGNTIPASTTTQKASAFASDSHTAAPDGRQMAPAAGPAQTPAPSTKAGLRSDQGA